MASARAFSTTGSNGGLGPQPPAAASGQGFSILVGWSFRETAGSGSFSCRFTETATGNTVAEVVCASSGSASQWFGPQGIIAKGGVTLTFAGSGTVQGAVYIA